MLASENNLVYERGLVAVRDEGEGRDAFRDDEVGEFASGHRTEDVRDTHRIGGVEGQTVAALDLGRTGSFGDHLPEASHSQKTRTWNFSFDIQRITCHSLIIS